MKTGISIPDAIFEKADQLAKRLGKTRSQLYQEAVNEYLLRHDGSEITRALDQLCEGTDTAADSAVAESSRRILYRSEW